MKLAAALLACAAVAMAVAAFAAGGGEGSDPASPSPSPSAAAAAGPPDGQAVWHEHGCGSCHMLEAAGSSGQMGPDLGETLRGMPAAYVRESIVDPGKVAAPNFSVGAMPEDYGERIPEEDLTALVAFIRGAAARE